MADYKASVEIQLTGADKATQQTNQLNKALGNTSTTGASASSSIKGLSNAVRINSVGQLGNMLKGLKLDGVATSIKNTVKAIKPLVSSFKEAKAVSQVCFDNFKSNMKMGHGLFSSFTMESSAMMAEYINIGDKLGNVFRNIAKII